MPKEAPSLGGGERNGGKTEYESGRSSWNHMRCLFDFFVPGVNQSRRQTAPQATVEPPPDHRHLDPQMLGRTMGLIQWQALASPLERWVSFRAGRWKGFVFEKGLQTSGDWAGRHPFKASEPWRSATRLWGYGLPLLCMAGTEGQEWHMELLFCFPSLLPHLEVGFPTPPFSRHSNVFTFLGL